MTGDADNTVKLDCGCDLQAVADAVNATGLELHQQGCTLQTGYGLCLDCGHLQPEHDQAGCQHVMPRHDWCERDSDPDVYCGCVRTAFNCKRCATCGGEISSGRCNCWALLADAMQQYGGLGYDDAASEAACVWDYKGDTVGVWKGEWLRDHTPAAGSPDAIVAALARMDYPRNDETGDCVLCDQPGCIHHMRLAQGNMVRTPCLTCHLPSCPWRQAKEWVAR